jgi:hypothetical protein
MITSKSNTEKDMVVSFVIIRRAVGILGIALPVVLYAGTCLISNCPQLKTSISAYYFTIMGTYFTGTLCAVGLFMFTYRGCYRNEQVATNIASVLAVGTALFPTNSDHLVDGCEIITRPDSAISNTFHYLFAASFFITLAYISIAAFPKLDPGKSFTKQKSQRNQIYRACGWIMLTSLALILALQIRAIKNVTEQYRPEFWLESITLWAFGIAWFVKGRTVLKDKPVAYSLDDVSH